MGTTASTARSVFRSFDAGEFTVAWLTFKGDAIETEDHRFMAKKDELCSSKLFRRMFGDVTMQCLAAVEGEYISTEMFVCTLVLCYEGNTEDRISYLFTMYTIVYGSERQDEGFMLEKDYLCLLTHLQDFNVIPKKFYAVFEESNIPVGGMIKNSQFVDWVRQYPVLMEFLASHLPPTPVASSPLSVRTSDDYPVNVDPLNHSPSCRQDKGHVSSFDFIGGEDSGDDSDELYDSDQISEMDEFHEGSFSEVKEESFENRFSDTMTPASAREEHFEHTLSTPMSTVHDPFYPADANSRRTAGRSGTSSRSRGVQKMGRNIGKAVGGGISKVGRSILHVGKSQVHHTSHSKTHANENDPAASSLLAAGFKFSSECQINNDYVCGYLQKISDGKWSKRSWHRRWFVLDRRQGILSYYRHNPATHLSDIPRGNIVQMSGAAPANNADTSSATDEARQTSSSRGIDMMQQRNSAEGASLVAMASPANTEDAHSNSQDKLNQSLLYVNKSHPGYRGDLDLNMDNVSLLFEKSLAKNAPTSYFFQVSTVALQDIDSKRGVQFKLCAETEEDFDRWTHAIAEAINRKHTLNTSENKAPVLSHQQLYRQRLKREQTQRELDQEAATFAPREPESTDESTSEFEPKSTMPPSMPKVEEKSSLNEEKSKPSPSPAKSAPPRIVTFSSPPTSVVSPWRLHITVEGTKHCLIVGFMVNIMAVKCIASDYVLSKFFVCIVVTCGFLMSIYHPNHSSSYHGHDIVAQRRESGGADGSSLQVDASQCRDPSACCLHRPSTKRADSDFETMASELAARVPGCEGPVESGDVKKFAMGCSMTQTEMLASGKSTNVHHSWATTRAETFFVRGLDYKKSKRKEPSQPALFEFLGADLLRTDGKVDLISQRVDLPPEYADEKLFILNAQLPSYGPSVWGDGAGNGPGYSLVLYWKIPQEVHEALKNPQTKPLRLLKRFLEAGNDTSLTDRFKAIAQVTNQDECGITGMGKKLLVSHNSTPVLTRPQHRIYHFDNGSTEIVVDIHLFSYIARRGIYLLLDKTSKLVIDIAIVLQGESEDELPEQILGCCRLDHIDANSAMPLPH